MPERLTVMFACNDRRGLPTGRCEGVEISGDAGDTLARLDWPGPYADRAPAIRWWPDVVRIGLKRFPCTNGRRHVGNLAWDSCRMELPAARDLVGVLRARGYTLMEWAEDGPIADLCREKAA